jgi:formamidopyrimidine-DNA glycosylase
LQHCLTHCHHRADVLELNLQSKMSRTNRAMPELPEVETVRRTLAPIVGATIESVWSSGKKLRLGQAVPVKQLRTFVGSRIIGLRRLGKYLLVDIEGKYSLLVHLGMSGRFRVQSALDERVAHTHVIFGISGKRELRYSDPRRFGQIDVVVVGDERKHRALAVLGPDPIEEAQKVNGELLFDRSRGKKTTLKSFVLDQNIVAGVGNIYASEALWRVGLRPTVRAHRLTMEKANLLAAAIKDVLHHALDHGGTSLRDFVDADGVSGENADYLIVYGRSGQPCPRCQREIRRIVVQGRATYYCPTCQKA